MKMKQVIPYLFWPISVLILLLSACQAAGKVSVPRGAQPGELTLTPCTYKKHAAECGALVVPERRDKPDARLIALPVVRIRATGTAPAEPIFWLAGGPGMSNMSFTPPDYLLANHDVVLVGYRGVDGTSVLTCPEVSRVMRGVDGDALNAASLARVTQAMQTCAARLETAGVGLEGYTMTEVIADLEAARVALGYPRINLLSESYGTRLAQIYAYLHPESLLRSAMIGVNPPGRFVWEPEMIDAQLAHYAVLCAQDAACSVHTDDLAETLRNVTHAMPSRWLFFKIDPGKVRQMTFVMLYHRDTAAVIFDTYIAAANGDPSGLALMSLMYDMMMPGMFTWGDLLCKGGADYDPARDYAAELDPPDAILGSPMGKMIWATASHGWPITLLPDALRQAQPTEVATLLIGGSVDFSTPAEYAREELLTFLKNGKQVIIAEAGHTGDFWKVQPKAGERLLTSFYDTGVADDSLYAYTPMVFKLDLGFPTIFKIALLVVTALVGGVGVGVGFLIRRKRKQRQSCSDLSINAGTTGKLSQS
ncbi:MAG: alpha/beta fold hydrolase [Anaerolineae bacterium]|nr:alpha/beta fold hydrolase [Anaerolineae bacterium]